MSELCRCCDRYVATASGYCPACEDEVGNDMIRYELESLVDEMKREGWGTKDLSRALRELEELG